MEKLDYCKQCQNRKFDMKRGIVCSLTDEKPAFENSCENYLEDSSVINHNKGKPAGLFDPDKKSKLTIGHKIFIALGLISLTLKIILMMMR